MGPEPRDPAFVRSLRRRALIVLAATWLAASAVMPASILGAGKTTTCSLIPQLRDVTVTQGVGAYARLVRGKEALARFYLSLPSCASTSASIAITAGSLTVSGGGLTTTHSPFPAPASPYPLIAPYTSAPALDAPGDPRFVIPGTALQPGGTTASFTATFSATITYLAKTSRTDTGKTGILTLSKLPGTQTDITRTVDRLTKALRVLAVPMGNASLSYASQFSSGAQSSLEAGMLTLSRIFPVPDGTGDLAGTTGGVRYTILPTLLDIGGLMSGGKFCGGGSNFDAIKGQLAQFLLSWNTANPSATADRVVGVADEAISNGSSLGCADGWSAIGTPESWVRAITTETPGRTGALLAMEIGHSMGLVPTNRDHTFDPYHSPNQEADGGTNRGYDIRTHLFIGDDRTSLRGTGTWNNATTLLEPIDYAFLLCMLGGSITTDCSAPGSVGTSTGVGQGPKFVLSGTTNGVDEAGTIVVESYFAGDVAVTEPPASSDYFLRQLLNGGVLREDPVAVETIESLHADADGTASASDSTKMLFAAVVPFDPSADRIELRKVGVADALYVRDRGTPPVIQSTQVVPAGDENYTANALVDDTWPTVSPDGAWVAWVKDPAIGFSRIWVGPVDDSSVAVELTSAVAADETQPAWNPAGNALAYISDGDVVIVAVDTSGASPAFGAKTTVYDAEPIDRVPPSAGHPSWSPDGMQIAFDANGAIFVVDAPGGLPDPQQLTFTGDASHPSWSWTAGDNRIAYQRDVPTPLAAADTITFASYVQADGAGPVAPANHAGTGTQFTVTSADDVNDGTCNGAHCSLREAINAANLLAGTDSIHFTIGSGPQTIQLTSALPTITSPVVIDGTTQPGWDSAPIVEIDGQNAINTGLTISAGSSDVIGLVIGGFNEGIQLSSNGGNRIRGNFIGTDMTGLIGRGGGGSGIYVLSGGNNTIGGTSPGDRNVIADGGGSGITLSGAGSNTVLGNFIGTDATGSGALGNLWAGVLVQSGGNTIGGTAAGAGNVFSGNGDAFGVGAGIHLDGTGNVVQGNLIGTDATGTAAIPNTRRGIYVSAAGNQIGGTAAGAGNVISGNIGDGIFLPAGAGTVIEGNMIGVDSSANVRLANSGFGIQVTSASTTGVQIGGTSVGAGNVISGNGGGVVIGSLATGAVIEGNLIGVGADGSIALGNSGYGVQIFSAGGNTIGGTAAGAGNLISNNVFDGVGMTGVSSNASGNRVVGNRIFANGQLGLDLITEGITANDTDDVDGGPNEVQNFPVNLAAVTAATTTVTGDLATNPAVDTFTIDVYANTACDASVADGNGEYHGEGERYLGQTTLVTDTTGFGTFSFVGTTNETGTFIAVTATDSAGNTSEFSACALAVADTGTLVVNSTNDPGTGGCTLSECTLREAINAANATVGTTETVTFNISGAGVHTIQPASQLPPITDPVTIDATSQPGYAGTPLIQLDGSALSPFGYGLVINAASSTVRGFAIIRFPDAGIRIATAGAAGGNLVADNVIGTDAVGTSAVGNGIGVLVFESPDNTIQNNVISGNFDTTRYAVGLFGGPSGPSVITGNVVQGNFIGTDASGTTALPNAGVGIVLNGVSRSRIGGIEAGQGNVIANSAGTGVLVADTGATRNAILGNSIHDNGSLGIDLGGGGFIAENDFLDPDTGPNDLQNYPTVNVSDDGTTIYGTLVSQASKTYRIEFFRNTACDNSRADAAGAYHGEGEEYLGFVDVTTLARSGYAIFTFDASANPILLSEVVTATATDPDGNTSEFSACAAPTPTGTQVWTVDPDVPTTTQEALVADAAQPSFGDDGRVAFVRAGNIYTIGADGTPASVAQLTTSGADEMPSLGGIPAFARFIVEPTSADHYDAFLLRGQVQVLTTFTDDNPQDLRLDLFYQCAGSPAYDVAVGLPPSTFDTSSASWITNYDPSLACPDGTLTAIASDGFLRSVPAEAGQIDSEPQAPVPTIYAPLEGQEFLQYQGIALHGDAKDAEDGQVADLEWFLDGASPPLGSGGSLNLEPPSDGWALGPHEITLVATDSAGTAVQTSVQITILGDADNDWLSADIEAACTGSDTDASNAFADYDADGYSNLDDLYTDEGPCIPAVQYSVFATFGPDVLYVPSRGDEVSITVTSSKRDLKQVTGSTVRISDLSGAEVSIPAIGWTVDKKGVGIARFDRQVLAAKLTELNLVGQTVTVTITGDSLTHSWTFTGSDTFEAKAAN